MTKLSRWAVLGGVLLTTLALITPAAAAAPGTWQPRTATYDVALQSNVDVPMSDGTVLKADVLRPASADGSPAPGDFPVLVTQTAYNKAVPGVNMRSDYLVQRGYVQVIADVRGTGSSPGTWEAFGEREQQDGYEIVEWAARQQWSDGNVGLHGLSYGGINQLLTAARRPPSLRAIFPQVPMGDAYRDVVGSGGQLDTGFIPLWLGLVTGLGVVPPTTITTDPVAAVRTLAEHIGGAMSFQGSVLTGALAGAQDTAYDGPFYQQRSPLRVADQVRVPTFIVGGQSDLFQRSAPLLRQRIAEAGTPAKLLFGPWQHVDLLANSGLPADDVPALDELELRWYDHYLRGAPDPTLDADIAPVTYHEQGTDQYRRAQTWPPRDVRYRPYRLDAGQGLMPGIDSSSGPPDLAPWNPIAGACSKSTSQWTAGLLRVLDCVDDHRLNDLAGPVYDLPVTDEPLTLAGPMAAHLTVATSARDGQLTVRVEDVAPDGTSEQITAGWQVLSLRALDEHRSVRKDGLLVRPYHPYTKDSSVPVPANTPIAADVELFPAAARIEPGHRLRIAVQTADFPHLTPPLPQLADSAGAPIRIYHDPANPSYVALPQW